MALSERKQQLSGKPQTGSNLPEKNLKFSSPGSDYKKMGGIPRNRFSWEMQEGPSTMTWSRNRGKHERKKMGEKILKEMFPGHYGGTISRGEIDREIIKLKRTVPQTQEQKNEIQEVLVRLEDLKKRTGL